MSPLRRTSSRRAREQRERRELFQRSHGPERCHWPGGCVNEAIDGDEILSRGRGGSSTDPDNVWLLCRGHHDWKHNHPAAAKAMGIYPSALPLPRVGVRQYDQAVSDTTNHTPKIAVRLSADGIAWLDEYAIRVGRSRSDVLRALFSVATGHVTEVDEKLGYRAPPPLPKGLVP